MRKATTYRLHLLAAFFLAGVAAPQLRATTVSAVYIFDGTCMNCPGSGTLGTGMLTLSDYTLGQQILTSNFQSFTYTSNVTTFSITPGTLTNISGILPITLPAAASVTIFGTNSVFVSQLNGQWCVSDVTSSCSVTGPSTGDYGFSGSFQPSPEPGTLGLAASGLVALAWWRRRACL